MAGDDAKIAIALAIMFALVHDYILEKRGEPQMVERDAKIVID